MTLSRAHKILCGSIFFMGISASLGFAAPRIEIEIEPPSRKIFDAKNPAHLKVRLEWPAAEGPYEVRSAEPKLENLALRGQNQSQEAGATIALTITYEFQPLKQGRALIYPFEVSYRRSGTEPWTPILIPEQPIQVVPSFPIGAVLTAIVLMAMTGALVYTGFKVTNIFKARKAAKCTQPPDPKQRVYAQAEEALSTFVSSDTKEKLACWALQLRTVVATYYDVPSKSGSSEEIMACLRGKGLQAGEWNEVSRLLGQLNEMQFARQDVPAYELEQLQKSLLQYVRGKIIIENSNS